MGEEGGSRRFLPVGYDEDPGCSAQIGAAGGDVGEIPVVVCDPREQRSGPRVVPGSFLEVREGVPETEVMVFGAFHRVGLAVKERDRFGEVALIGEGAGFHDPSLGHERCRRGCFGEVVPQLVDTRPAVLRPVAVHQDGMLFD